LGYTNYNLAVNATAFALNFGLNLVLIPQYSYVGAAIASAAAYLVTNILAIGVLKQKFNITPFSRHSLRVYIILPIFMIPLALSVSHFVSLTAIHLPIALVATGIVTLFVVVAVGGVQAEDSILLNYLEAKIGQEIPVARNYIPGDDV